MEHRRCGEDSSEREVLRKCHTPEDIQEGSPFKEGRQQRGDEEISGGKWLWSNYHTFLDVWSGTLLVSFELVVVLPYDTAILVGGVPDLGAEETTAVTAYQL